jgi:hypothetical protein
MATTIEATLTVEQIADAFVALGSNGQAEFFGHVARACKREGFSGELQWHYVCGHLDGDAWLTSIDKDLAREGRSELMALAAPLYLHTLRAAEGSAA